MYECQGARWGWGETQASHARHHANVRKVELTLGMMPRAQELGICWRSSTEKKRKVRMLPTTPGFPIDVLQWQI